jgi:hypothetical protein
LPNVEVTAHVAPLPTNVHGASAAAAVPAATAIAAAATSVTIAFLAMTPLVVSGSHGGFPVGGRPTSIHVKLL